MKEGDGTEIALYRTVQRFINKCPNLTHVVLHGLGLSAQAIKYLTMLPATVRFLDLAMNAVTDEDMVPLFKKCPSMESIDLAGTCVTALTMERVATEWGGTIVNLTLPHAVAEQLTLYDDNPDNDEIQKLLHWIKRMKSLQHIRIGEHRLGMATEWHRSFRGETSLGYIMERRMIGVLEKTLPTTIKINISPYEDNNDAYYRKYGVPKPNPGFPPKSSPSYIFQTLGRKDKTNKGRRNTYRDHYPNSRWLSPTRCGPREYYLEGYESLEERYGWSPPGDIRVPNMRSTDEYITTEIANDNVWYETEERKPPENDEERVWTSWENLAHLDLPLHPTHTITSAGGCDEERIL